MGCRPRRRHAGDALHLHDWLGFQGNTIVPAVSPLHSRIETPDRIRVVDERLNHPQWREGQREVIG